MTDVVFIELIFYRKKENEANERAKQHLTKTKHSMQCKQKASMSLRHSAPEMDHGGKVQHDYHDHANAVDTDPNLQVFGRHEAPGNSTGLEGPPSTNDAVCRYSTPLQSFPTRLHYVFTQMENDGQQRKCLLL